MEDFEPFTLTYICPHTGIKFSIYCHDDGKADDEFHRMFERCGYNVAYSVD